MSDRSRRRDSLLAEGFSGYKCIKCGAQLPEVGECLHCAGPGIAIPTKTPSLLDKELYLDRRSGNAFPASPPPLPHRAPPATPASAGPAPVPGPGPASPPAGKPPQPSPASAAPAVRSIQSGVAPGSAAALTSQSAPATGARPSQPIPPSSPPAAPAPLPGAPVTSPTAP